MPKYRKKPVVIEAFQHTSNAEGHTVPYPRWFMDAVINGTVFDTPDGTFIKTLEGNHQITDGDFVIQGVKGELYPCKPDIFAATYDTVSD